MGPATEDQGQEEQNLQAPAAEQEQTDATSGAAEAPSQEQQPAEGHPDWKSDDEDEEEA
jgi:hypothetical protein